MWSPSKYELPPPRRLELHLCVRWPLSAGFLLPIQLGDALPGEPLGVALPEPVGNRTVGAHRLPPVQEEILPQDINQQFILDTLFYLWFISTQPMFIVRLHIIYLRELFRFTSITNFDIFI